MTKNSSLIFQDKQLGAVLLRYLKSRGVKPSDLKALDPNLLDQLVPDIRPLIDAVAVSYRNQSNARNDHALVRERIITKSDNFPLQRHDEDEVVSLYTKVPLFHQQFVRHFRELFKPLADRAHSGGGWDWLDERLPAELIMDKLGESLSTIRTAH